MRDELRNIVITNEKYILELQEEFKTKSEQISKKVYTSVTEERLRINKILKKKVIKGPIEEVFKTMILLSAKDLHPNLNYDDLKEGGFYRSSGKTNKIPFLISKFEINKEVVIKWYAKDQQFIKSLFFFSNSSNTKTTIRYSDITTGMVSILGFFERHIRGIYTKRQIIAFEVQCIRTQLMLNLIPSKNIKKKEIKIENMLKYSKTIY